MVSIFKPYEECKIVYRSSLKSPASVKIELTAGSQNIQIQWLVFESEQIIHDEMNGRTRGCFIRCKTESKDTAEKVCQNMS